MIQRRSTKRTTTNIKNQSTSLASNHQQKKSTKQRENEKESKGQMKKTYRRGRKRGVWDWWRLGDGRGRCIETLTFFGEGRGSTTSQSHVDIITSKHVQPTLLYRLFEANFPLFKGVGEVCIHGDRITTNPPCRRNKKGILTQLKANQQCSKSGGRSSVPTAARWQSKCFDL